MFFVAFSLTTADSLDTDPNPAVTIAFDAKVAGMVEYVSDNPEKYPNVDMLAAMNSINIKPDNQNTCYLKRVVNMAKLIKCTASMNTLQFNDLLQAKGKKDYNRNAEIWLPARDKNGTKIPKTRQGRVEVSNKGRYRRITNNKGTKFKDQAKIIPAHIGAKADTFIKLIAFGKRINHANYQWVAYAHQIHPLLGEIPTHMQETEGGLFKLCYSVCHLRGDHDFSEACDTGKSLICFVSCDLCVLFLEIDSVLTFSEYCFIICTN